MERLIRPINSCTWLIAVLILVPVVILSVMFLPQLTIPALLLGSIIVFILYVIGESVSYADLAVKRDAVARAQNVGWAIERGKERVSLDPNTWLPTKEGEEERRTRTRNLLEELRQTETVAMRSWQGHFDKHLAARLRFYLILAITLSICIVVLLLLLTFLQLLQRI